MIQLIALSKIIQDKDEFLMENVKVDHFSHYKDEYLYILDYYARTGELPSEEEFFDQAPSIVLVSTNLTSEEIIQKLDEERIYEAVVAFCNEHRNDTNFKDELLHFIIGL